MKKIAMICFDGFYIATQQYMVVDTPVFDEIMEGIQVLQFYPFEDQQEGLVSIAELGELEDHPQEVNTAELSKQVLSHVRNLSREERDVFWYNVGESGNFPKWMDILDTKIFHKKKNPNTPTRKYLGKYTISKLNKIVILTVKKNRGIEENKEYAEGQISEDSLSLVYHHRERDWISVFKFVPFGF